MLRNEKASLSESQIEHAKREYGYGLSSIKKIKKPRALSQDQQRQHIDQMKFRKDPWKFAKELFHPPSAGQPTFSMKDATAYFSKLYSNSERLKKFEALPE